MCAKTWSTFFSAADAGETAGKRAGGAASTRAGGAAMSVAALLVRVKDALAGALPGRVTVVGEISNFNRHGSGHLYFSLKDADAAIDAVMFRTAAGKLKFDPADGLEVVASGRVDVYEVSGRLQLYVSRLTPRGTGSLELAFKQLCHKLRDEGLFDASAKKPLCRFPRAIGVVTSPTGAAIRDIGRTLRRRWPGARVYLAPALVQGRPAGDSIVRAISLLDANAERYGIDTIIVSRGGGSLEDLWAFNEESVARAIFAAKTPIISGVGHEVDVTIADMVADVRAATPTAAAELAAPDAGEVLRCVQVMAERLGRCAAAGVKSARAELDGLVRSAVFRDPAGRLRTQMQRIDELSHRLGAALQARLVAPRRRLESAVTGLADHHPRHLCRLARQQTDALARQLNALSYRSVLARGFSVTRTASGAIIRSAGDVTEGDSILTSLADGEITSRVLGGDKSCTKEVREPRKRRLRGRRGTDAATGPLLFDRE